METDHKAFVYLNLSTKFMILDWLDFLLNYNFYIVFKKGSIMFYQTISLDCIKKNTKLQMILLNQQLMLVMLLRLSVRMSLLKELRDILKSLLGMYLIKKN